MVLSGHLIRSSGVVLSRFMTRFWFVVLSSHLTHSGLMVLSGHLIRSSGVVFSRFMTRSSIVVLSEILTRS